MPDRTTEELLKFEKRLTTRSKNDYYMSEAYQELVDTISELSAKLREREWQDIEGHPKEWKRCFEFIRSFSEYQALKNSVEDKPDAERCKNKDNHVKGSLGDAKYTVCKDCKDCWTLVEDKPDAEVCECEPPFFDPSKTDYATGKHECRVCNKLVEEPKKPKKQTLREYAKGKYPAAYLDCRDAIEITSEYLENKED